MLRKRRGNELVTPSTEQLPRNGRRCKMAGAPVCQGALLLHFLWRGAPYLVDHYNGLSFSTPRGTFFTYR